MHLYTFFLAALYSSSLLPLLASAQAAAASTATAAAAAASASVTLVPFSTLPPCAAACGPLYDAQGACTPPAYPVSDGDGGAAYAGCFCQYATLQPFAGGSTAGVCDAACPDDATGLAQIQSWFAGYCGLSDAVLPTTTSTAAATGSPTSSAGGAQQTGGGSAGGASSNGDWFSKHWKYVVMIIVIFLVVLVGWISACFFRRRYLRRRERDIELRGPLALGPHQTQNSGIYGQRGAAYDGGRGKGKGPVLTEQMVMGTANERYPDQQSQRQQKKKSNWVVKERT